MPSRIRARLSYANVMASLALFVALGGVSYAAIELPRNSVGTEQLKKGAVTKAKIGKATRKALKGNRGPRGRAGAPGATGPQGPQGPAGPAGTAGAPGISGYEVVVLPGIMKAGVLSGSFSAKCPEGKKLLGGGYATFNKDIQIETSTPQDNGTTWSVATRTYSGNPIAVDSAVNVRITCAFVAP